MGRVGRGGANCLLGEKGMQDHACAASMSEGELARVAWDPETGEAFYVPMGRMEAVSLTIGVENFLDLQVGLPFYNYCIGNNVSVAGPGERANCELTLLPEEEAEARR